MPTWGAQLAVVTALALVCFAPYQSAAFLGSGLASTIKNERTARLTCGRLDWAKKTGTDAEARHIKTHAVKRTSMAYLLSLRAPAKLPMKHRKSPAETTVWSVRALLVRYRLTPDRDYSLVIHDDEGRTMIAQIPDPRCVSRTSRFAAGIKRVRAAFAARYRVERTSHTADILVRIEGVGFFNSEHGQSGAAINDIELHPVLSITFLETPEPTGTATVVPSDTSTVTPTAAPSDTPTVTPTAIPSNTSTATPSASPDVTATSAADSGVTVTPQPTETPADTPTALP